MRQTVIDVLAYGGLAIAAAFALLMLYRGLFPSTSMDAPPLPWWHWSRWMWGLFQIAFVIWLFDFNEYMPEPASPVAVVIVGLAIGGFLTFVGVTVFDWLRLLLVRRQTPRTIGNRKSGELAEL